MLWNIRWWINRRERFEVVCEVNENIVYIVCQGFDENIVYIVCQGFDVHMIVKKLVMQFLLCPDQKVALFLSTICWNLCLSCWKRSCCSNGIWPFLFHIVFLSHQNLKVRWMVYTVPTSSNIQSTRA